MRYIHALILMIGGCSSALGDGSVVLPANFDHDGRSASELSADWWKWAFASPADINPVRDTSGTHCAVGQTGDIWFLAGGFGSSKISRRCTIPRGKYLFFPAVNMVYWPRAENNGYTCDQAKRGAAVNNDTALDVFVEIDGVAIENAKEYRAPTEDCFDIYERVPPQYHPYRAYPSASDGYWFLLRPLQPGTHQIRFGGRYKNKVGGAYGRMVQDIEYLIVVE